MGFFELKKAYIRRQIQKEKEKAEKRSIQLRRDAKEISELNKLKNELEKAKKIDITPKQAKILKEQKKKLEQQAIQRKKDFEKAKKIGMDFLKKTKKTTIALADMIDPPKKKKTTKKSKTKKRRKR